MAAALDAPGGFTGHVEGGILDLAVEFVPWNDPMVLDVHWERGMFGLLVCRVLIFEVGDCGG